MNRQQKNYEAALTLIEILIVDSVIVILADIILPALARAERRSARINCLNNIKQIGLSFRTWALDHQDKYPMQVQATNGGTFELIGAGMAFMHFAVMSNELSTPRIVFCPQENDPDRVSASTFASTVPPGTPQVPYTNNNNISYFVGVDATDTRPQTILTGDRNLSVDGILVRRRLQGVWTNSTVTWAKPRHNNGGNIGLADGSVRMVSDPGLRKLLIESGVARNRLDLP